MALIHAATLRAKGLRHGLKALDALKDGRIGRGVGRAAVGHAGHEPGDFVMEGQLRRQWGQGGGDQLVSAQEDPRTIKEFRLVD